MARVTRGLLWLFVFSLPWENVSLPFVGRIAVVLGVAAACAGLLATVMRGRLRTPGLIVWLGVAFVSVGALSSLWTLSVERTIEMVTTYFQLIALVWLIWEFVETPEQQRNLFLAFCLGMLVPLVDVLLRFNAGIQASYDPRYTAAGVNANDLGLACALTIPIAVNLVGKGPALARIVAAICLALSPIALLLTGGRGPFLAGVVAASIVPLTLPRLRRRSAVALAALLVVCIVAAAALVPDTSWARIQTISEEFNQFNPSGTTAYGQEGTLSGRVNIWLAGWQTFLQHPLLGVGAGAFEVAVEPLLEQGEAPHNIPIAVLVEQGIVGLLIFAALVGACGWVAWHLPRPDRTLWMVLLLTWFVGVMSANWQYRKLTWLLFALLAVHARNAAIPQRARSAAANGPLRFDDISGGLLFREPPQRTGRHSPTLPA